MIQLHFNVKQLKISAMIRILQPFIYVKVCKIGKHGSFYRASHIFDAWLKDPGNSKLWTHPSSRDLDKWGPTVPIFDRRSALISWENINTQHLIPLVLTFCVHYYQKVTGLLLLGLVLWPVRCLLVVHSFRFQNVKYGY